MCWFKSEQVRIMSIIDIDSTPSSQDCLLCEVQAYSSVGKGSSFVLGNRHLSGIGFLRPPLTLSFLICTSKASQASLKEGQNIACGKR